MISFFFQAEVAAWTLDKNKDVQEQMVDFLELLALAYPNKSIHEIENIAEDRILTYLGPQDIKGLQVENAKKRACQAGKDMTS